MTDREALRAAARMVWAHLVTSGPAPWERTEITARDRGTFVEPTPEEWLARIESTLESKGFFYGHGGQPDATPAAAGAEGQVE